jgi:hypothetical protein
MTSKLLTRSVAFAMVASLTLFSCLNENDDPGRKDSGVAVRGKLTVLGKQLENPFSVRKMEEARQRLLAEDSSFASIDIQRTHYYVKFKPADYLQYDLLVNDTTIQFLDHPFDYEIIDQGDYYHEPGLADTIPTYQYAAVPASYSFPANIAYQILEELYLPEDDQSEKNSFGRTASESELLYSRLEREALALTNNLEDETGNENTNARTNGWLPDKWYPSGRILVYDNRLNSFLPLVGAKVQTRRWFKIRTDITDRVGYFKIEDGYRYPVNYSIPWERGKFDIRSGTFGQARFNGPKKKGSWILKIYQNGMSFHYAHVFRAAMRYYYGDIGGLKRPGFRLKYSVFDKKGNHLARNIGNWSAFGINPNILIYRYDPTDGSENDSDEMFSTTCHETAHTTHMEIMNAGLVQFIQVSEKIRESWAVSVEWFLTQKEYKQLGISDYAEPGYNADVNYPIRHAFQYWNTDRMPDITSLFIDLVDRNNQKGQSFGNFQYGTVNDPVYGFTLPQIESGMLKKVYGISSLKEQLKANKTGELTDNSIDILLQQF